MKLLHKNKLTVIYFFFALMFIFKLIAIQEYIHIEQHKEERIHQSNCQLCHTIFQVGKYQSFESPDIFNFISFKLLSTYDSNTTQYKFIHFKELVSSELYNRPPPVI